MKKKEEFLNWLNGRIWDRGGMLDHTLANAIGVSQSTARRIMIGEKTPSIPQIVTMAYVFDDLEHLEELLDMAGYSDRITTNLMKNTRIFWLIKIRLEPGGHITNKGETIGNGLLYD